MGEGRFKTILAVVLMSVVFGLRDIGKPHEQVRGPGEVGEDHPDASDSGYRLLTLSMRLFS
jgi:hypothetical protein